MIEEKKNESCSCWKEKEQKLKETWGLTISNKCRQLRMDTMKVAYGLPLEKADGSRMTKKDPAFMQISHCPFCGQRLSN